MYRRIDPRISASRGTLAGDLLWLARGYWFHLSHHHRDDRLSGPVHCSSCKPVP
jgi:hypothetical protein